MYPNIYYAVKDLFGWEIEILQVIQSFGFFVAMAFLAGAYFFGRELKRKEEDGLLQAGTRKVEVGKPASVQDLIISGIVGFLFGFKLIFLLFNQEYFAQHPQAALLSADGNIWGGLLGGGIAVWLKYREKQKEKLDKPKMVEETVRPHEHVGNITLIAALFGLLGAKIFHLLENPDEFAGMFDSAESFFSGLTIYGGIILGGAAVIIYGRKHKLKVLPLIDASAPALILAYGIGRLGCQVSGDGDWGIVNNAPMPQWLSFLPDWIWAYSYPNNVIHAGVPIPGCEGNYCTVLPETVFPTPLYETAMALGIFVLLWSLRKKLKVPGMMFALYMIFNGVERFFIEKIRVNELISVFGMQITQAEIISVIFVLAGIAGMWWLKKRHEREKAGK